jgi:2-dehydropantoate 2-reductase
VLRNSGTVATPGMRELMLACGQEALEVGLELGHQVLPIFRLDAEQVSDLDTVVATMLDALNGLVVSQARARGRETPADAAVVEVAHRIEHGELEAVPENLSRLLELSGSSGR